jgi:hypothetical protein
VLPSRYVDEGGLLYMRGKVQRDMLAAAESVIGENIGALEGGVCTRLCTMTAGDSQNPAPNLKYWFSIILVLP